MPRPSRRARPLRRARPHSVAYMLCAQRLRPHGDAQVGACRSPELDPMHPETHPTRTQLNPTYPQIDPSHPDRSVAHPQTDRTHPQTDRTHPQTDRTHPQTDRTHPQTTPTRTPMNGTHPQTTPTRTPMNGTHPQTTPTRTPMNGTHPQTAPTRTPMVHIPRTPAACAFRQAPLGPAVRAQNQEVVPRAPRSNARLTNAQIAGVRGIANQRRPDTLEDERKGRERSLRYLLDIDPAHCPRCEGAPGADRDQHARRHCAPNPVAPQLAGGPGVSPWVLVARSRETWATSGWTTGW
jgi:hypothetical protein